MDAGLIGFIVVILFVIAAINYTVFKCVRLYSEPDKILNEVPAIEIIDFIKASAPVNAWCETNGFKPEKQFQFHGVINGPPVLCGSWKNEGDKTRVLIYVYTNRSHIDIVTLYNETTSLTTASSRDAYVLPNPPTSYIQVFTGHDIDALYRKHLAARSLLETTLGLRPVFVGDDIVAEVARALRQQMAYIKSLPLWQLKGAYWYLVRPYLKSNKPVAVS